MPSEKSNKFVKRSPIIIVHTVESVDGTVRLPRHFGILKPGITVYGL